MLIRRPHPHPRLAAGCALLLASLPASALAQYAPAGQPYAQPGQYTPYPQQAPYPQQGPYPQGPYAQPLPYSQPYQPPGYQPLPGNEERSILSDRAQTWPILRVSPGAAAVIGRGGEPRLSFELDIAGGFRFALQRRLSLMLEGGYTFSSEPTYGGHFGAVGAGPSFYLHRYLSIGWIPKLVLGDTHLGFGIGARNTLLVPLLFHVVNVELGHQWLHIDGRDIHELRAQLGIDLGGIAYLTVRTLAGRFK